MIAELAESQHGVVSRRQLLAVGVTDQMIKTRLATRRLFRVHDGVYSLTRRPGELGLFKAATLATHGRVSHRSAAALWDLMANRGSIDVKVVRGGERTRPGIRVHATRSLHPADSATNRGIPCTSVPRTIVDLAAVLAESEVRRLLERSILLRLFDRNALDATLARANGRRGTGTLRRLLYDLDDDAPRTRSEMERRFLELVRAASVPSPITNGLVNGYEVDFHWPAAKLIVETDGRETHDNPFAFERDRQRDLELKLAGWEVIRITWRQLRDQPERVVAVLGAHLGCL